MSSQKTCVSTQTCPYIELTNNRNRVLRFQLDRDVYRLGRNPLWADTKTIPAHPHPESQHWEVISRRHAILRREGQDYRIFDGDEQQNPSSNGLWLNRVRIKSSGLLLQDGMQLEIGQDLHSQIILTYFNRPDVSPDQAPVIIPSKRHLDLSAVQTWPVELGREPHPDRKALQLEAPTVSRLHATIEPDSGKGYRLVDHSTNGTFVNGKAVSKTVQLKDEDVIQLGPFTLLLRDQILELYDPGNEIRLDAHQLFRQALDQQGREKIILDHISLPIEPGQLVALVGGSGTGKSTLLKTLLGIAPTQAGTVYINGQNLRQNFEIYRSQIGYVPQDDIVYPDLTVGEVLRYTCQLRLPPETHVEQAVKAVLQQVKLDFVKNNFIKDLSGGQRKRVSIAVELLANPRLFFLDEPTSGLDPGLDKAMMKLLRKLANQGRTIILVTHATANIAVCDRVAFLGRGGRLCYFGPPQEAMRFFQLPENLQAFPDIYLKLEQGNRPEVVEEEVKKWARQFRANSAPYKAYIQAALGTDPEEQKRNSSGQDATTASTSKGSAKKKEDKPARSRHSGWRQLRVLCQRYGQLMWRDRASLAWSLLPAPLGILLTALTSGRTPFVPSDPPTVTQAPDALTVLFVFTFAAILSGLLSSLPEIVKEASVYLRERLVNLGLLPYLGSKLIIRSGLALLQTLLITIIILLGFQSATPDLIPWPLGVSITTFLTIFAALSLGLAVSALAKTASAAMNSLTFILLPQIIFSGVIFKLEEGFGSIISWFMVSRWSVGAYGSIVNVNALVPEPAPTPPGVAPPSVPFAPTPVYDPTWENLLLNWVILCFHGLIYLLLVWIFQRRKDII